MRDEDIERQLRIDLAAHERSEMTIQIERLRREIRMENRKFFIQAIAAAAAAAAVFATGGVAGGLIVKLITG
jgi:hypothetical protein